MKICAKCNSPEDDLRTIRMDCFYDMSELKIPLILEESPVEWSMRVCKSCRADWLHAIKDWFHAPPKQRRGCGSGIWVRDFGTNMEITEEEWHARQQELKDE